jgi:hypothetical protein
VLPSFSSRLLIPACACVDMLSSCSAVELSIRWASTITQLSLPADSLTYDSLHAAVSALSLHPPLPSAFQLGYLDDERDFVRIR